MFEDVQYNGTFYVNDETDNDWVRIFDRKALCNSFTGDVILSDPSFIEMFVGFTMSDQGF